MHCIARPFVCLIRYSIFTQLLPFVEGLCRYQQNEGNTENREGMRDPDFFNRSL